MGKKSKRKRQINRVRSQCPLYAVVAAQAASVGKFMIRRYPSTKNQSTSTKDSTKTQSTNTTKANQPATLPHTGWIFVQEDHKIHDNKYV